MVVSASIASWPWQMFELWSDIVQLTKRTRFFSYLICFLKLQNQLISCSFVTLIFSVFSFCGKPLSSRWVKKGGCKQGRDLNSRWWCLVWLKSTDHSHGDTAKNTTLCPASVEGSQKMTELRLFKCVLSQMTVESVIKWKHHCMKNADTPSFVFVNWLKILCCWVRVSWNFKEDSMLSNPTWSAWENSLDEVQSSFLTSETAVAKKKKTSPHGPFVSCSWPLITSHGSWDVGLLVHHFCPLKVSTTIKLY